MTPMVVFIVINAIIFILAIALIVHGKKSINIVNSLAPERKKMNLIYRIVSTIHMCLGIFVVVCYIVAAGIYLLF